MAKKVVLDEAKFLASEEKIGMLLGQALRLKPRKFGTGSLGYFCSGKIVTEIDGQVVTLQVSLNAPICGTKPDVEVGQ